MRFPKQEIDVDAYLKYLSSLLALDSCEIFIDTNIISQLYRLNEDARKDVYRWIDSCKKRFHIPIWCIQEYSKRVYQNSTHDYVSELGKIKTYSSDFKNISRFIKAYMSTEMLKGTQYAEDKQALFSDLDSINNLLNKVARVIKNNISEHRNKVHSEIIEHLEPCALKTDIYSLIKEVESIMPIRYDGAIPPGFKDNSKDLNSKGDLVIWMELLAYCKKHDISKAILLSRDCKSDMVYEPSLQIKGERKASETERVRLAHESLVYEFKLATNSNDFYIIDFDTLVKLLAPNYRELAKSFQISVANDKEEQNESDEFEKNQTEESVLPSDNFSENSSQELNENPQLQLEEVSDDSFYSGIALIDSQYASGDRKAYFDDFISKLSSHDWYVQNPALDRLMGLRNLTIEANGSNLDSTFVLGRNILQSAEGSSGSAITFMENISIFIGSWPYKFKQALIDGMLFEIFFDSMGKLRRPPFKASYMDDLLSNISNLSLLNPFDFINEKISKCSKEGFAPKVGTSDKYKFTFTFDNSQNVTKVECNEMDITYTYPTSNFPSIFAYKNSLRTALSVYYAIPEQNIELSDIPKNIISIGMIVRDWMSEELPF